MYPKATKPPAIEVVKQVLIDGLYYPESVEGMVRKDVHKWEAQLSAVLPVALAHVKHFDLVVDGGAFVGRWSGFMPFKRIISFEPIHQSFECLKRNAPQAECHKMALADYNGEITLGLKDGIFGNITARNQTEKSYPCVKLDWFHVEPDLIKLDLDGCDLMALKGMAETIERCSPVLIVEHKLDPLGIKTHIGKLGYKEVYTDKRDSIWVR